MADQEPTTTGIVKKIEEAARAEGGIVLKIITAEDADALMQWGEAMRRKFKQEEASGSTLPD